MFTPDGLAAIYVATDPTNLARSLMRSPLATPAPATLTKSYLGAFAISPSGAWVAGTVLQSPTGFLALSSATAPGTPKELAPPSTDVVAAFFTLDSSHLVFVDANLTLGAVSVSGVAPPVALSLNVETPQAVGPSAVVVFTDNGDLTADIFWVDTASVAAPTKIASEARYYFLTAARDKVVVVWSAQAGPKAGLYVLPLP